MNPRRAIFCLDYRNGRDPKTQQPETSVARRPSDMPIWPLLSSITPRAPKPQLLPYARPHAQPRGSGTQVVAEVRKPWSWIGLHARTLHAVRRRPAAAPPPSSTARVTQPPRGLPCTRAHATRVAPVAADSAKRLRGNVSHAAGGVAGWGHYYTGVPAAAAGPARRAGDAGAAGQGGGGAPRHDCADAPARRGGGAGGGGPAARAGVGLVRGGGVDGVRPAGGARPLLLLQPARQVGPPAGENRDGVSVLCRGVCAVLCARACARARARVTPPEHADAHCAVSRARPSPFRGSTRPGPAWPGPARPGPCSPGPTRSVTQHPVDAGPVPPRPRRRPPPPRRA